MIYKHLPWRMAVVDDDVPLGGERGTALWHENKKFYQIIFSLAATFGE
jgi:hypothetical protein